MFRHLHLRLIHLGFITALLLLLGTFAPAQASHELTIRVADTTIQGSAPGGWLTVFVINPVDSIAGFTLYLHLNRPDAILFDSIIDTAGTVLSGFHEVDIRSLSGQWTDFKILALADAITTPPPYLRGFGPSATERVLFRAHYHQVPPIPPPTDRVADVYIDPNVFATNFARPDGTAIGLKTQEVFDTLCFKCLTWNGQLCLSWVQIPQPPCDSSAVRVDTTGVLDTSLVSYVNGSVTAPWHCPRTNADIDINNDGVAMTVLDEVMLIRFVNGDTDGVANPFAADINGDCVISWADVYFIDSLFKHPISCEFGPCPLPCACDHTPSPGPCCWQRRGNLNGDVNQTIDLADLSYLINFLTIPGTKLGCEAEANINGVGIVDLADLSYLVAYLTAGGNPPAPCPGYSPPLSRD